jgi:hypothetical protein
MSLAAPRGDSAEWFAVRHFSRRFRLALAGLCLGPLPAFADGKAADCGGDAYTFAEVVPAQRGVRQRGPITVLPDTLCADLAAGPSTRIESLNVDVDPRGTGAERPHGGVPAPSGLPRRP